MQRTSVHKLGSLTFTEQPAETVFDDRQGILLTLQSIVLSSTLGVVQKVTFSLTKFVAANGLAHQPFKLIIQSLSMDSHPATSWFLTK